MQAPPDVDFALPADAFEREAVAFAAERLAPWFEGAAGDGSALFVVSSNAGSATAVRFWADAVKSGVALASPELFPWCLANAPCGALARRFGITGPNATWLGGDAALPAAAEAASTALAEGRARRVFLVAVDFGMPPAQAGRLRGWHFAAPGPLPG